MTAKQTRFIAEYLVDLNATQAAIRVGYSPRTANRTAAKLMAQPEIAAALATAQGQQIDGAGLTAARVLEELRRVAFVDIRGFYDERGKLKPMAALTPEQGAALAGVESMQRNVEAGDGVTDTVYKIKLWDKSRALEALCKRFGLLVEKIELTEVTVIETRLNAARARLAARRAEAQSEAVNG